ncbi:DUF7503 family protein [Halapricum desulfuricans]|nr:hypothetical protein [Halapricum desulfuricans]
MSHPESEVKAFLAEHPKMIGVLFTTLLLLTQAGAAAAGAANVTYGP